MTPAESIASLKESARLIGSVTSQMTDEEYAVLKDEIEKLEAFLNAVIREVEG